VLQSLGPRASLRLGAWLAALAEGVAAPSFAGSIGALLEAAVDADLTDAEREAVAEALDPRARAVLDAAGFDTLGCFERLCAAVRSDQRGNLSRCLARLVSLVRSPQDRRRVGAILRARLAAAPERRSRSHGQLPFIACLADEIGANGIPDDFDEEVCAAVDLEATALVRPNSDFLLLGLGRRAGDEATLRAVFDGLASPWVRGQLLRRLPVDALRTMALEDLPGAIDNALARSFAFESVIRARGDLLDDEACTRVLTVVDRENAEMTVVQVSALIEAWSQHKEAPTCFTRLWSSLGEALAALSDDYAARVVDIVATRFPSDRLPCPPMVAWTQQVATRVPSARAAAWPRWIHKLSASTQSHRSPADAAVKPWHEGDAATLAFRAYSFALDDPGAWDRLPGPAVLALLERVGPCLPDFYTLSVMLRLGARAPDITTYSWTAPHRDAHAVATGTKFVNGALLETHLTIPFADALLDVLSSTDVGDRTLATLARHPRLRAAIRERIDEYREFDLGRTTNFVASHGRALLMQLCEEFLPDSFAEGAAPASLRPVAQNLCAEALARHATRDELDALVTRWISQDRRDR
jgi:hypothetical protein